ncbi:MAG: hypothetical protein OEY51_09010, partial [Cyclobacteriaceae bacterium]|nr:hypothetical protein [Cyclobacteriaceae bacterium]
MKNYYFPLQNYLLKICFLVVSLLFLSFSVAERTIKKPFFVAPTITGATIAADNAYVDVTFDQGVEKSGGGALTKSDFSISITTNAGGNLTGVSIASITKTDGSALAGSESTIRFNLTYSGGTPAGIAAGVETIKITPSTATSVYNLANEPMAGTQSTGDVLL